MKWPDFVKRLFWQVPDDVIADSYDVSEFVEESLCYIKRGDEILAIPVPAFDEVAETAGPSSRCGDCRYGSTDVPLRRSTDMPVQCTYDTSADYLMVVAADSDQFPTRAFLVAQEPCASNSQTIDRLLSSPPVGSHTVDTIPAHISMAQFRQYA